MKYFLDTEFIEDGKTIDLISIGLACEDGRTLYHQNVECDFSKASDWVWRHVFPHLSHFDMRGKRECRETIETYDSGLGRRHITSCRSDIAGHCPWATKKEIAEAVIGFCDQQKYGGPEFWGYYADYDWVVFCQLFGRMIDLPKGFPMYCRDIKQVVDVHGIKLQKPLVEVHHALRDALWVKESYKSLIEKGV